MLQKESAWHGYLYLGARATSTGRFWPFVAQKGEPYQADPSG